MAELGAAWSSTIAAALKGATEPLKALPAEGPERVRLDSLEIEAAYTHALTKDESTGVTVAVAAGPVQLGVTGSVTRHVEDTANLRISARYSSVAREPAAEVVSG